VSSSSIGSYRDSGPLEGQLLEVFRGVARGETALETGRRMYSSAHTVAKQRRVIVRRLGARNLASAVAIGYRRGILE